MAVSSVAKAQSQPTEKLTAKDIVLLAVFGVITFLVFMVVSMVCSFSADMMWWTHAIGAIPGGIVWIYLMTRVPKRGAAIITGAIMAIVALLMGMAWTGPLGMFIGGALCELIMMAGKRSKWAMALGFAVFVVCWWFGQLSLIVFTGEAYVQMIVDMGMPAEYGWGLVNWVWSPAFPICALVTIGCACLGAWFGMKIFQKHFAKLSA